MSQTGLDVFDTTLHKTNEWLNRVQEELGWGDRQLAYHALRATLHTLRDRILVDEVAHLGAQLPLLIRGIYYEGWSPSDNPVTMRSREAFLEVVGERYGHREPVSLEDLVRAVFRTMNAYVPASQLHKIRDSIGGELQPLWPEPQAA